MKRLCFVGLLMLSLSAQAQDPAKPGGMQSGNHAAPAKAAEPTAQVAPAGAAPVATADFDVVKLFANTCGWCHSKGGREAGKGPQLMGTTLTDPEIVNRIKVGKVGQMPAFASAFNDEQMKAIVLYIRNLKPVGS